MRKLTDNERAHHVAKLRQGAGGYTSTDLASFWQTARVANCGAVALWRGRSSSGPQESAFSVRARSWSNSFVRSSATRAAPCIFLATESTVPALRALLPCAELGRVAKESNSRGLR